MKAYQMSDQFDSNSTSYEEISNICLTTLFNCIGSNNKEALDFIYHLIQEKGSIFRKEQYCQNCRPLFGNPITKFEESDENKLTLNG